MGAWYGNVTLRDVAVEGLRRELRGRGERGWLIEDGRDIVVLAAGAEPDAGGPAELGARLSAALGVPTLSAMVLDSDVLLLWLHVDGREVDAFVSDLEVLAALDDDIDPAGDAGGDIEAFALAFPDTARAELEAAFRPPDGGAVFAEETHAAILAAVGLSDVGVSLGFAYADLVEDDELPAGARRSAI